MMRQKLAFVVFGPPSVLLSRMNGFSPVRITRLGSAGMLVPPCKTGRTAMLGHERCRRYADTKHCGPPSISLTAGKKRISVGGNGAFDGESGLCISVLA